MVPPSSTARPLADVGAIVLAAGSSSRMGRNKLLLELGGETVIRRAVRRAGDAGLDPVVVVLGHEARLVERAIAGLPCLPVVNPDPGEGQASSLRAGVAHASGRCAALVVLLGDMPLVTPAMIAALVQRHRESGARVVVSRYGETSAPPTLFDQSLFPELLAITGEREAREVVRRHEAQAAFVSWPAEWLADLDDPGDYERVSALLR